MIIPMKVLNKGFPKDVIKGNMVMVIENILRYLPILFLYDYSNEGSQQSFPKDVIKGNMIVENIPPISTNIIPL